MHAATSLGNGFILFTGGVGTGGVAECNVELYSYLRDTISLSGTLPECPHLHQQITLSPESAMIIGGEHLLAQEQRTATAFTFGGTAPSKRTLSR